MEYSDLIDAAEGETDALMLAIESGELDDVVPTCSEWEIADLARHVGGFCGFWTHVLCEGTGRPKPELGDPPEDDRLPGWTAQCAGYLFAELRATPAECDVWTFFDADQHARFVARRGAHELAVHRTDAQWAHGAVDPIGAELAADGIDEVLDVLVNARGDRSPGTGRVMTLRSSDLGSQWFITLDRDHVAVERRSEDDTPLEGSNLVVTGTASDLELTLYHRPTLSPVDVHGDYTVLEEWHRRFTF